MKSNELVWRTIADESIRGNRRWDNYADLAYKAGVPETTAQLACRKLVDIGAISTRRRGGFSTVSPEKVLTVLAAWRNLKKDTLICTTEEAFQWVRTNFGGTAAGGPDAAIFHLGGRNTVSDYSQRILYVPEDHPVLHELPRGTDVTVLHMDARAQLDWDGYSSLAQTYADLFATPGWQASEFRLALRDRFFANRDWDQEAADAEYL